MEFIDVYRSGLIELLPTVPKPPHPGRAPHIKKKAGQTLHQDSRSHSGKRRGSARTGADKVSQCLAVLEDGYHPNTCCLKDQEG